MSVTAYSLEGRTLLKVEDFSRIVAPFVGSQKTAADIERARRAVQQAYLDLGYCGVRVNTAALKPRDGVVRFRLATAPYKQTRDCLPRAKLEQLSKPTIIVSSSVKPVVVAKPAPVEKPAPVQPAPSSEPPAFVPPPRFDITRFEMVGSSLLTAQEMDRLVAPHTGKNKDFADIQRALEALERGYRDLGYGVVQVLLPEQDVTKGVVQFRVLQPKVGRVLIEGNTHFDAANIRRSLPTVKEGETPNSAAIARNLQLLGEHPTKHTNVLLRSGASEEQVDVNIKIADERPRQGSVTLDNTGNSQTGQLRLGVGYQLSNLFNRDHTLTAQYITSPTQIKDVTIFGVGYRIPFYDWNSSLDLIAGYSDVNSGTLTVVGGQQLDVSGSGAIYATRWNYYLPKWGEIEQKVALGLDYRAFKNEVIVAGTGIVPDITIHPASLSYIGLWRMAAAELKFYAGVSTNLPGGNDGEAADFQRSRAGATANYLIYRYGFNYFHQFRNEWQMRVEANAQYTQDELVAGEQFGVGGPHSVRGYQPRELSNDRGYAAQLELYTPDIAKKVRLSDSYRLRLLGFYDFGEVYRNNPLPGELNSDSARSAGIGLRLGYSKTVSLRVDAAQILHPTANRSTSSQRINASLSVFF